MSTKQWLTFLMVLMLCLAAVQLLQGFLQTDRDECPTTCPEVINPTCPTCQVCDRVADTAAVKSTETMAAVTLPRSHPAPTSPASQSPLSFSPSWTSHQQQCDLDYGWGYVRSWASNPITLCSPQGDATSRLVCYTHKQAARDHTDIFCEAFDFVVDFSKVGKQSQSDQKRDENHDFSSGVLSAECDMIPPPSDVRWASKFERLIRNFHTGARGDAPTARAPVTYLLQRDTDSDNPFHMSADFINVETVFQILGLRDDSVQMVLFDRHPDGHWKDMFHTVYGPAFDIKRVADYRQGRVLFPHLVFHLQSPASIVAPHLAPTFPCRESLLVHAFRKRVLTAYGLWDVAPPPVPTITLLIRRRTESKNMGRILANQVEVEEILAKCTLCRVLVVDMAILSFQEQLTAIRNSNIIVGIHGAAMANIYFAAEEAVLLEIHPHYRLDRHFRQASRLAGKIYMPMRSMDRVACQGTSDDVTVPLDLFEATLDGAVRIARSFAHGLSECGLVCDISLLAFDAGNDPFYAEFGVTKVARPSTNFPCPGGGSHVVTPPMDKPNFAMLPSQPNKHVVTAT